MVSILCQCIYGQSGSTKFCISNQSLMLNCTECSWRRDRARNIASPWANQKRHQIHDNQLNVLNSVITQRSGKKGWFTMSQSKTSPDWWRPIEFLKLFQNIQHQYIRRPHFRLRNDAGRWVVHVIQNTLLSVWVKQVLPLVALNRFPVSKWCERWGQRKTKSSAVQPVC